MISTLLIVQTRSQSVLASSLSSSFRLKTPKPAKPLGLKAIESAAYPRNSDCQTHFAYLTCFQQFNLEERAFFSKRVVQRSRNRCLSSARHDMSCSPSPQVVMRQRPGDENMPTIRAGMWLGINGLPGKSQIGCGRKLISHNALVSKLTLAGWKSRQSTGIVGEEAVEPVAAPREAAQPAGGVQPLTAPC